MDDFYNNYNNEYRADDVIVEPAEEKPKKKKKSVLKKIVALALSGVLVGGVAAGTFIGITRAAAQNGLLRTAQQQTQIPVTQLATSGDSGNASPASYMDVSSIVEEVMPSIVAITNTQVYEQYNLKGLPWFFGGQSDNGGTYENVGSGSGIIIGKNDTELLLATNYHVIDGADSITITFVDGSTVTAYLKGGDSEADLAVVAVALNDLSVETLSAIKIATIGDSGSLKVGQGVIAIGNAMGYGQSTTVGYISALNRDVTTADGVTRNLLQTDAAINPGNSGGALLNMKGEVIGINSAKMERTDVEGIGYAIPISEVQDIITDLMNRQPKIEVGADKQGYIGISGATVSESASQMYNMPIGVLVADIPENSPAKDSGLQINDIITKFDGETVSTMADLKELLTYYEGGSQVELSVKRMSNGMYEDVTVTVTLGYAKDMQQ